MAVKSRLLEPFFFFIFFTDDLNATNDAIEVKVGANLTKDAHCLSGAGMQF